MPLANSETAVTELLARIRLLELVARRNAAGLLAGDYVTSIPGRGLLFHETRKYVPGEPARRIDWNITARLGEPYVKVHLEERQRDVIVALDISPSMHTGFQAKSKLELGVELAATLAVSAIESGDRLGHVLFADRVIDESRPRGGRQQLFQVLRSLLAGTEPWKREIDQSNPRVALEAIERQPGRRFVVFLISDFIDHDVPEDLKYIRARHDVSLLHVFDPVEFEVTDAVRFRAVSPERSLGTSKGPAPRWISPGETGNFEEMAEYLEKEASHHRIAAASFSTADSVVESLGGFLSAKRRRARR